MSSVYTDRGTAPQPVVHFLNAKQIGCCLDIARHLTLTMSKTKFMALSPHLLLLLCSQHCPLLPLARESSQCLPLLSTPPLTPI